MSRIEEEVLKIAEPAASELGCGIVDCEYKKEGKDWILRVAVDKEDGVGIDDCENVSRALSDLLDQADVIKDAYLLEVSSPGLERELKKEREFLWFLGRQVSVKLFAPMENGSKEFIAVLEAYQDGIASLRTDDGVLWQIPKAKAAYIRLYAEF